MRWRLLSIFITAILFDLVFILSYEYQYDPISAVPNGDVHDWSPCMVTFKDSELALCHFLAYGKNFGDEIGIAVAKKLLENHFHCSAERVPVINLQSQGRAGKICLFNLGSIFDQIQQNDHVWGTGINPTWQKRRKPPAGVIYHAVRGLLTLNELETAKVLNKTEAKSIGIGDPGTAVIHLFQNFQWKSNGTKQPCFVPHHQDEELFVESRKKYPDIEKYIQMVSVRETWRSVIKRLSNCSSIASSSLHGLVVADSLGIPSRWFQFSQSLTQKTEGFFKYQDYFTTIGRLDASPLMRVDGLLNKTNYWSPPSSDKLSFRIEEIERSFPYYLFKIVNGNGDEELHLS
mmetsp:Transcript_15269/g.26078  ORF Transcript_15269/g.26078 Transcript_15269/m.26078 type:complete len:346 (-) Transcript_15269:187-1224(-)|eukprot:CAMPEP_0183728222 /NCGR_PEP_ID=MMETSP0737-20130205/27436_1 /TAXON_ID=385413 /ORGANISM="Thalassiosira miniscula, Strain CCMP1093" /LENGTH=345 /DNA_ID=CAMNT_0025960095 /DNA_START=24 /DNA_END=1061 /DNA_ORIENTATION=+